MVNSTRATIDHSVTKHSVYKSHNSFANHHSATHDTAKDQTTLSIKYFFNAHITNQKKLHFLFIRLQPLHKLAKLLISFTLQMHTAMSQDAHVYKSTQQKTHTKKWISIGDDIYERRHCPEKHSVRQGSGSPGIQAPPYKTVGQTSMRT